MATVRDLSWVLDSTPSTPAPPPTLDADQLRVAEHRSGAMLVLAGPGTGKTTTIVEAVVARLRDPVDPLPARSVLALTFGRRAATELRDRIAARLVGGEIPLVATFHSFAFGLLQSTAPVDDYPDPPRLMSGAEEDVRIRELLRGAVEDGTIHWPEELSGALGTLGLANEVRAVLARSRALGMDGDDLRRLGQRSGRSAWAAVGALAEQEAEVMALEHVMDYAELLRQATVRTLEPRVQEWLHRTFRAVFVDEYQDTDPAQVALLQAIVGPAASLVAVGDPDQAIYGFRGADVRAMSRFQEEFGKAEVVVLGRSRRFGPELREAATRLLGDRAVPGLALDDVRRHRAPVCDAEATTEVQAWVCDSEGALAAQIAEDIRRQHVYDGVPWQRMAVLVRAAAQIPPLQRSLRRAGVPVTVAADEIPLRSEPAVAVLLAALRAAAHPDRIGTVEAADLLGGPLGGLDAGDLRRLGRLMRSAARKEAPDALPPPSAALLRDLVRGHAELPDGADRDREMLVAAGRLVDLLQETTGRIRAGSTPMDALWLLWSGEVRGGRAHGWPERLRAAALGGSSTANHDLDAVIALFDAADRAQQRNRGVVGVTAFLASLEDQQIPAEPVAERGALGDRVRILTAHRAKGLEWDAVWVVGAEEGSWPDLRPRGSVLEAERLQRDGVGDPLRPADLLAEERRLFYVACTRARRRLVVAAIDEEESGGARPSRFLADLGVDLQLKTGRPRFPTTLEGMVARLRSVAEDPDVRPAERDAAVSRLASMALELDEAGRPLVPDADPATWWGRLPLTQGAGAVRDPNAPLALSGSSLETLLTCPLRWFLDREVDASPPSPPATRFGNVVHAIAEYVGKEQVPADIEAVDALVDRVWRELRFEAPWQSDAERAEARAALGRFVEYHLSEARTLVATEAKVQADIDVPTPGGGVERIHLRGFIDRVERDDEGRPFAVDLKNMRTAPTDKSIPENPQLGVYQVLLRERDGVVGGAALVQLRVAAGKDSLDPKVQMQAALPDGEPTWIEEKLGTAAAIVRAETFVARPGSQCRTCGYAAICPAKPEGGQVIA